MTMTVRLDPKTESAIERLARRKKQTKSAIVREAIASYERDEAASGPSQTPAAAMAPFIGIADSGRSGRSERTGEGFRALVTKKARARRSR